jgi:hypothetical protein
MKRIVGAFGLLVAGAGELLIAGQVNPLLRFPKESDRAMVLFSGAILIIGMMLIVNALRRRADRGSRQD